MSGPASVLAALTLLARGAGMSRATLDERRGRLLRSLVLQAYRDVPFYGRSIDRHGVDPKTVHCLGDLSRLPLVSKEDLRSAEAEQVVRRGVRPERLILRRTSGSAGQPLLVRRTWLEEHLLQLFRVQTQFVWGLRPGDRFASVGIVRGQGPLASRAAARAARVLGLYDRRRIDIFREPAEIGADLARLRPDVISGYPGVLAEVADWTAQRGESVRPRLVMTAAEVLTPLLRERIESGFAAPVFDAYACHEVNLVAWQCPKGDALHTCNALIVEVLRDGESVGPGESGEVVVTGLLSHAMPFIRYRLGDVATRGVEPCACGRPGDTLRNVQGRVFEYFVLPDGRRTHAHEIGVKLAAAAGPWVRRYQLVQEGPATIVYRVVPNPNVTADIDRLKAAAHDILGTDVKFLVETTDSIPREPSGKVRMYRGLRPATSRDERGA